MKEWKVSLFNEYIKYKGKYIIYNNLSGSMIEVGEKIYTAFETKKFHSLSSEKILQLSSGNFIVPLEKNEIDDLRRRKEEIVNKVKVIGLQILPTLGCNFECIYCYENVANTKAIMKKPVMDSIVEYVKNTIKPTTEYLNISWFGGEPLIAIKSIEYLSKHFLSICKKNNINYYANIITNGYLLTKKNVDLLKKYKVKQVQVTIDGPKKIHNSRRPLKNGKGTYSKIIKNLQYASLMLDVWIRINIDKTNILYLNDLITDLKKNKIFDKVHVRLGLISLFANTCKDIENISLSKKDVKKLLDNMKDKNIFTNNKDEIFHPIPDFIGCVAEYKNSFIIGPKGELYKCSKTIGMPDEKVGNISNIKYDNKNLNKWLSFDKLLLYNECKNCSLLPLCNKEGCLFDFLIMKSFNKCKQNEKHKEYKQLLMSTYLKDKKYKEVEYEEQRKRSERN